MLPAGPELGATAQDASQAVMAIIDAARAILEKTDMTLLLLEAFGAMVLLIFIVWWTMFSGRKNGEIKRDTEDGQQGPDKPA